MTIGIIVARLNFPKQTRRTAGHKCGFSKNKNNLTPQRTDE